MKNKLEKKHVNIHFTQMANERGRIHLYIKTDDNKYEFFLSNIFPPWEKFFDLIENIILGNFPYQIYIDQEGSHTIFHAKSSDSNETFELSVYEGIADHKYFKELFNTSEFVLEFLTKLKQFIDTEYSEKDWLEGMENDPYGPGGIPMKISIEKLDQLIDRINNQLD